MCDYDGNVKGCDNRMKMSCTNKTDGFYTIGCSSTFFSCVNGQIVSKSVGTCQDGLFYDSERNTCDHKFRVRACGGNPEMRREPVTRPPLVVATFLPNPSGQNRSIYTARIRGRGHHHRRSQPTTRCHGKPDGPHPVSSCSQQYITCANAMSQLAECPDFQVFSSVEHKCVPIETVRDCSESSHASAIDCSFKEDGYYGLGCKSSFVFCSGGKALAMECPNSLVFNERKGYCDYEESCAGVSSSGAATVVHTQPIGENSKSVSNSYCSFRKDGFYSEGCSRDFVSCDHGHATPMVS
ncbi:unnamed protein product [Cylicostephanus goldi]|uniref:Chitin-binding type-2 domain-containing protein n=1 Tax=Cylicostephanus goldi TaxID=71465 RepID=A0A3P6SKF8_CYLGO|nr:unnamed protein product [Cylicostephanus goldi]